MKYFHNDKLLKWLEDRYYDDEADAVKKLSPDDENIWANIDKVAFDQEDLADLLDEDIKEVFLCNNRFSIPLRVRNKKYIGIGNAVAIIRNDKPVNFQSLGIEFKNVAFNAEYLKILPEKNPPTVSGNTAEVTTEITNRSGIHGELANIFIKKACSFDSEITLKAKGMTGDAKSMITLMQMGMNNGLEITIVAQGEDARRAVTELKNFIDSGCTE